ncbi:MAG: hypothetical protein ACTTIV_06630 [Campylobacter sp.]
MQICKIFRHKLRNLKRLCIFSHWVLSAQFIADFLYFCIQISAINRGEILKQFLLILVKFSSSFGAKEFDAKDFDTKAIGSYFSHI